jgi:hypothetical protein
MTQNASNQDSATASALQSLLSAAEAANSAYNAAVMANPGADLSQLYLKSMQAQQLYWSVASKSIGDPDSAQSIQTQLDATTQAIKGELTTIQNVTTWITLVGNLVQLATTLAGLFA